ncbi:MAG: MMPL family transporter [Pseudomonadota bacterium]
MNVGKEQRPIDTLFAALVDSPRRVLALSLVVVFLAGAGLRNVAKDPSVDAFVPDNHPAALARDRAREVFGLEDPVVIGLTTADGASLFQPAGLQTLRDLDLKVRQVPGVKKNDVVSLASENAIAGNLGDLDVEPVIPEGPLGPAEADRAWARYQSMPMLPGLLGSANGSMALVIVPVEDPNHAGETVARLHALVQAIVPEGYVAHVAGVAAMNARLAAMVDGDTRIFIPAAILTVLVILFIALRRVTALAGPLLVIAGSAAVAIGTMGWLGARYYLITTALPVVIMAIAVADSLHLCVYYLKARTEDPDLSARDATLFALNAAWLPISLTSVTTVAAFCGLSFGAAMQPISEFGLFAALGVTAAWVLSLSALPAVLVLTNLTPRLSRTERGTPTRIDRLTGALTAVAFDHPGKSLAGVAITLGLLGFWGAQAQFGYERQRYFTEADVVRLADRAINEKLGGINFLDVVVTAPEEGGLMTPAAMKHIAGLRQAMAELPLVVNVTGIDEYISLMHSVLTEATAGTLPDRARAPGQYMFLYEASAAPEDFKQEIDYTYTRALVRTQLSTDNYRRVGPTLDALAALTDRWQVTSSLRADISGRVAVNNGWMDQLSQTHFRGLGLAVTLVLITTLIVFRSLAYALLAMVPIVVGVLCVYAAMGGLGIDIAPATSMTAAIATGLGVDFGIHLISLVRRRLKEGASPREAFSGPYTVVARACFYSAVALGVALAVICISSAPPLRWFGFLVSVGAFGSLIGALIIVPAFWVIYFNWIKKGNEDYAVSV